MPHSEVISRGVGITAQGIPASFSARSVLSARLVDSKVTSPTFGAGVGPLFLFTDMISYSNRFDAKLL